MTANNSLRNVGGAFAMGVSWAVVGAIAGYFMELVDPHGVIVDVWVAALMYPGFFGGAIFFTLLRVFERHKKLAEVSLPRATAWGAFGGVLLPVLLALALRAGLGDLKEPTPWSQIAVIVGVMILAFAGAGCATVAYMRLVAKPPNRVAC